MQSIPLPSLALSLALICIFGFSVWGNAQSQDRNLPRAIYGHGIEPIWDQYPEEYKQEESRLHSNLAKLTTQETCDLQRSNALQDLARFYLSAEKFQTAESSIQEAIKVLSKTADQREEMVKALILLAGIYNAQEKTDLSISTYREALNVADAMGEKGYYVRLNLLTSWLSDVPSDRKVEQQLALLSQADVGSSDTKNLKQKGESFFELSRAPENRGERAIAYAREAFDAFEKGNDFPGMLKSVSRLIEVCQGRRAPYAAIEPNHACEIGLRIDHLLTRASAQIGDTRQPGILQCKTLQTAIEQYAVAAEPQQAWIVLNSWAEALRSLSGLNSLESVRLHRSRSLVLALLARVDWRLNALPKAEAEYRQSIKMSQHLWEETTQNFRELSHEKDEARRKSLTALHGPELFDLENTLTPLVPNNFLMDKALAQLGLASLYCDEGKIELGEREYLEVRQLPVGFTAKTFSGLVTKIANGYLMRGNIEKAQKYFGEIKEFYGSNSIFPFEDISSENPIIGHMSPASESIDSCLKFMNRYPAANDSAVIQQFNQFKRSRVKSGVQPAGSEQINQYRN